MGEGVESMFNKKQAIESVSQDKFNTLVGKNTSFQGELKAEGTIRIDGEIKGEVSVKGDAYIGETGSIIGNIHATNIIVSGKIEGNVYTSEQLRITTTGKVIGDIKVKSFIVDEDAFFEGKCTMIHGSNIDKNEILEEDIAETM